MVKPLILRIAIADGEHARFVQPDPDNVLRTVASLDSAMAHTRSRDIGTDQPGRSFESGDSAHHAVGPRHDLHRLEKEKFLRLVAEQLIEGYGRGDYDQLVLVAPARALTELRDELNEAVREQLVGTLEKDLVKTTDDELSSHLREWVDPVRRPAS